MENQPQPPSIQIEKERYLNRLSEVDRKNLIRLEELFKETMREKNQRGALLVVGGSLTKPIPRKDIDLLFILENPQLDKLPLYKDFLADFRVIQDMVKTMIKKDPNFRIQETIKPAIDEEFGMESLLKHDGSITLKADKGVPIEFIRSNQRKVSEAMENMEEPYVMMATVTA